MALDKRSRLTHQRRRVLERLKGVTSHPTAEEVYGMVKEEIPNISLGTVYRNLNLLRERGEVLELASGKEASRWDGCPSPHYHFTCQTCGRVYDVPLPYRAAIDQEAAKSTGFTILHHHIDFVGRCTRCPSPTG